MPKRQHKSSNKPSLDDSHIPRLSFYMLLFRFTENHVKPVCGQLRLACATSEAVNKRAVGLELEHRLTAGLTQALAMSSISNHLSSFL